MELQNNIQNWYQTTYPTDDQGREINPMADFRELYLNLPNYAEFIGVCDSIIRERIFEELADRSNMEYNTIYDIWLNGEKIPKNKPETTYIVLSRKIRTAENYDLLKRYGRVAAQLYEYGGIITAKEYGKLDSLIVDRMIQISEV